MKSEMQSSNPADRMCVKTNGLEYRQ